MDNFNKPKDIVERTRAFAVRIIRLSNNLPKTPAGFAIANQIVRSGTSVGANVIEAQDAVSKPDFTFSMSRALKESRETEYWLLTLEESKIIEKDKLTQIKQECKEIVKILTAIVKKSRGK